MENLLDRKLERLAFEYLTQLGVRQDLIEYKIKELKICAEQGYNSRAELILLVKSAMVSA